MSIQFKLFITLQLIPGQLFSHCDNTNLVTDSYATVYKDLWVAKD